MTATPSSTKTPSMTATPSSTKTPSMTGSPSITTSPSITGSSTATATATKSASASASASTSATPTPTVTTSTRPNLQEFVNQISEIPLTSFSNDLISNILDTFQVPQTDSAERVQPPYDLIAAGFFATNPNADPITIVQGDIVLTLAKLDPTIETTLGSAEAPIVIPPLPIPADAIVYVSQASLPAEEKAKFNLSSNSQSIGVVSSSGSPYEISGLADPITIGFGTGSNSTSQECTYWNVSTSQWSSDGCTLVTDPTGATSCQCTHLTEFALRFRAIADINAGIINSLSKLLTAAGLKAAAPIIGLLGALGLGLLASISLLVCLDRRAARHFSHKLDTSQYFMDLRSRLQLDRNQSWDSLSTSKGPFVVADTTERPETTTIPETWSQLVLTWLRRIPYFHPWLSIIVRYDPGLPRLFRAIFIVASFITTIAVSILFYGFKHAGTDTALELSETIVLSLMTTAVSMPLTKIMIALMNAAGRYEFRARYGHLATEMIKRQNFLTILRRLPEEHLEEELRTYEAHCDRRLHQMAEEWIAVDDNQQQQQQQQNIIAADASAAASAAATTDDNFEEIAGLSLIYSIFGSCFKQSVNKLKRRFRRQMTNFITQFSNKTLIVSRLSHLIIRSWPSFPLHTNTSAFALIAVAGWMAWCYTYILGFTALKSADTVFTIIQTVAISLVTSHVITQPVLQLVFLIIAKLKHRRAAPRENNFYYLQELNHLIHVQFVGECSLVPCMQHNDVRRSVLVCSPDLLMQKVVPPERMSAEARTIEELVQYIYDMLD